MHTDKSINTHRQPLPLHFTLPLLSSLKNSIKKFHPPLPISKRTFPGWSWRPRSLIPPPVGKELALFSGLFSFSATVSRLGTCYQVSLLFIFFKTTKVWSLEGRGINPTGKTLALFLLLRTHSSKNKQMRKPEVKGRFHQIWNFLNGSNWVLLVWGCGYQIRIPNPSSFLQSLWVAKGIMKIIPKGLHGINNLDIEMKGKRKCLELFHHFNWFLGQFIAVQPNLISSPIPAVFWGGFLLGLFGAFFGFFLFFSFLPLQQQQQ